MLTTSNGYEMRLAEAMVDIASGNVVSEKPVEVKMRKARSTPTGSKSTDSGDVVRFERRRAMHGRCRMRASPAESGARDEPCAHRELAPSRSPCVAVRRRCSAAAAAGAAAQPNASPGVPNALQGFSQNRDQPVKIEAASLEVRDKDKVATFSGNVQ